MKTVKANGGFGVQVNSKYFLVIKDFYGLWVIFNADSSFKAMLGCPPYSTGHPSKKHAIDSLIDTDSASA